MLAPGIYAKFASAFDLAIDSLGVPVSWTSADGTRGPIEFTCGLRTVGRGDIELVNAYGLDTRVFTARTASFAGNVPEEFDTIIILHDSQQYTLNSVHEIWLNAQLVGYRMLAKANR